MKKKRRERKKRRKREYKYRGTEKEKETKKRKRNGGGGEQLNDKSYNACVSYLILFIIVLNKRYFIKDQQIARHFDQYSEYFSIQTPHPCNSINQPFS